MGNRGQLLFSGAGENHKRAGFHVDRQPDIQVLCRHWACGWQGIRGKRNTGLFPPKLGQCPARTGRASAALLAEAFQLERQGGAPADERCGGRPAGKRAFGAFWAEFYGTLPLRNRAEYPYTANDTAGGGMYGDIPALSCEYFYGTDTRTADKHGLCTAGVLRCCRALRRADKLCFPAGFAGNGNTADASGGLLCGERRD